MYSFTAGTCLGRPHPSHAGLSVNYNLVLGAFILPSREGYSMFRPNHLFNGLQIMSFLLGPAPGTEERRDQVQ